MRTARHSSMRCTWIQQHIRPLNRGSQYVAFGIPPAKPEDKGKPIDTQASYAIPLAFNIFAEADQPAILEKFCRNNYAKKIQMMAE